MLSSQRRCVVSSLNACSRVHRLRYSSATLIAETSRPADSSAGEFPDPHPAWEVQLHGNAAHARGLACPGISDFDDLLEDSAGLVHRQSGRFNFFYGILPCSRVMKNALRFIREQKLQGAEVAVVDDQIVTLLILGNNSLQSDRSCACPSSQQITSAIIIRSGSSNTRV